MSQRLCSSVAGRTRAAAERRLPPPLNRALLLLGVYAVLVLGGELLVGMDSHDLKASASNAVPGLILPLRRLSGLLVNAMPAHGLVDGGGAAAVGEHRQGDQRLGTSWWPRPT